MIFFKLPSSTNNKIIYVLDRIGARRLTDCLRSFTGFGGEGLRIACGFLPDLGEEAYGLFSDFCRIWWRRPEEAYELFTDFYRIWGKRLADCLWISIGFGGEGLRIVCGFLPDVEDEAYGLFTDVYRM